MITNYILALFLLLCFAVPAQTLWIILTMICEYQVTRQSTFLFFHLCSDCFFFVFTFFHIFLLLNEGLVSAACSRARKIIGSSRLVCMNLFKQSKYVIDVVTQEPELKFSGSSTLLPKKILLTRWLRDDYQGLCQSAYLLSKMIDRMKSAYSQSSPSEELQKSLQTT